MSRSRSIRASWLIRAFAAPAALLAATPASAHGFGARYELPLPLSLYLFGAAAAIAVSFVIAGLFVRQSRAARVPRVDLLAYPLGRLIAHDGLALVLRLVALVILLVAVLAGFIGSENPYRNIAPTLVWIVWWVGFAYVSAFAGDVWRLINPWRTVFAGAEWLSRKAIGRATLSLDRPYPARLGVWPAVLLLLGFSWIELVYPNPAVPLHLAWLVVGYSILTFAGMVLFGRETWLRHGEVFTVVFGTLARFAPTEARVGPPRQVLLRPFGAGLLDSAAVSNSMTAFVLLLLATVLFDGASTSPEWTNLESGFAARLSLFGDFASMVVKTAGLVVFWLLLSGAYVGTCAIMSLVVARQRAPFEVARSFAFTLVPIAIGYHVAHYLVFLLIQGQYIIPLISDPFGYGWDLFGTAGYRVDIALVGARFAWYAALTAVLIGHLAAVYLAHRKAMQLFEGSGPALRSQVPLTALMVVYTFVSLSILAEPVVERREPAQPVAADVAVPEDAVLPEPGNGRLQAVGSGKLAKAKLTYRVFGSAFHDGTKMTIADLMYSTMFAYRWGTQHTGSDAHYDSFIDAATAPMRRHLVALRVVGTDTGSKSFRVADVNFIRELFIIEVYASIAPEDPEQEAQVLSPWSTLPWHVLVLMEEAVSRGFAAFSQAEAERRGVEWLDLVRSKQTNAKLAALIETFARDGYRPEPLRDFVSVNEAQKRWAALAAFHKTYGHLLVTNGPYRLKRWSGESVTLEAFRDLSYPLGVGSFDAYAIPRRGFVTAVEWSGNRVTLKGDIEIVEKFQRSYRLTRTPLQSLGPEVAKRAAPECSYTIVDDKSRVALTGFARLAGDSTFQIDLGGRLPEGSYTMFVMIALAGNVMNAEIRRVPVTVLSTP